VQDVANEPGASLSFGDLFGLADVISAALGDGNGGTQPLAYTTIDTAGYLPRPTDPRARR